MGRVVERGARRFSNGANKGIVTRRETSPRGERVPQTFRIKQSFGSVTSGPKARFGTGCVPNVPHHQFGFSPVPSALPRCPFLLPCVPAGVPLPLPRCSWARVLARRGFSAKSVAARICREAGERLTPPTFWCAISILIWRIQETPEDWRCGRLLGAWRFPTCSGHHIGEPSGETGRREQGLAARRKERRYHELV